MSEDEVATLYGLKAALVKTRNRHKSAIYRIDVHPERTRYRNTRRARLIGEVEMLNRQIDVIDSITAIRRQRKASLAAA